VLLHKVILTGVSEKLVDSLKIPQRRICTMVVRFLSSEVRKAGRSYFMADALRKGL
jgi:hypothetical protein